MGGNKQIGYQNKENQTEKNNPNSIYELLKRTTFPENIDRKTKPTKSQQRPPQRETTAKPIKRQQRPQKKGKTLKDLWKAQRETTAKPMCGSTVKLHIHNGQVNKGDIKEEEKFDWQEIIAAMTISTMVLIIFIVAVFTISWYCRMKKKARKMKKEVRKNNGELEKNWTEEMEKRMTEKIEKQMQMMKHGPWLNPALQNGMVTGMVQHGMVQNGMGQNGMGQNGMVQNGLVQNSMVQNGMVSHSIGMERTDNGKAILINSPNNPPN